MLKFGTTFANKSMKEFKKGYKKKKISCRTVATHSILPSLYSTFKPLILGA